MESIRAFIAVELPSELRKALAGLQSKLKAATPCPAKWVAPENIHLTLCFLGDINPSQVNGIQQTLNQTCAVLAPFKLYTDKLGTFPNDYRPQVVWLGLRGDLEPLSFLHKKIEAGLALLGFKPDNNSFSPHLTLARLCNEALPAERQKLGETVNRTICEINHALPVSEICLMRSSLTPAGAIYTRLSSHNLNSLTEEKSI
jgi:2'-5' RNA ligase